MFRKVLAVGENIQSGLVDAALRFAGLGPRGHASASPSTALAIPLATCVRRRVAGVQTVASGAIDRPVSQDTLVARLTEYLADASKPRSAFHECVVGLWKSEGLATSAAKQLLPENTLRDPRLPARALPVIHVGFGTGVTAALAFDETAIPKLFGQRCRPEHVGFSYEGIGAVLRIHERGFFKIMSARFGLVPIEAQDGPASDRFYADYLAHFPPDIRQLIVHGYGRLVAFTHTDIVDAVEEATTLPCEYVEAAVRGAGFAFAMMNNVEVERILRNSAVPFDRKVRAAFQNGLVYGLAFAEWYRPGLLAAWQPRGAPESDLVDHARREAAGSIERGYPLAFQLSVART